MDNTTLDKLEAKACKGEYITRAEQLELIALARAGSAAPAARESSAVECIKAIAKLDPRTTTAESCKAVAQRWLNNPEGAAPTAAEGPSEPLCTMRSAFDAIDFVEANNGPGRAHHALSLLKRVTPLPTKEGAGEVDATDEDADEAHSEGIELLDSLIDSIATDGPYGAEATLTFLSQIRQCFVAAQPKDTTDTRRDA